MQKTKLNANPVGENCVRSHFEGMPKSNKGITLIALIITIIVMLILVGVTVNVALNGGLFSKAETATYQTEASLVKEQLELAKAVETANNEGILNDYSFIKVENLDGLDEKTKNKFKDIILVNSNGDICYNPANVTDEEKTMLEAIGIKAYEESDLGLNVDTNADYIFNPVAGMRYTMNFTDDGKIKFKYNEEPEIVIKPKDIVKLKNDEEGYKVKIHISLTTGEETFESDVKLKMDTNNEDILAYIVVNGEEHTFIKYEPVDLTKPRVYGQENAFIIITPDNRVISYATGKKYSEGILTKVNNIREIDGYSEWELEDNGYSVDLYKVQYFLYEGETVENEIGFIVISKDYKTIYATGNNSEEKISYVIYTNIIELNELIDPTPYL